MNILDFGRFEFLRIERGELVLSPWPPTVRGVKFGAADTAKRKTIPGEFELKRQVAELLEYTRSVESGEIRRLQVRNGLPTEMEVEMAPDAERRSW